MPAMKQPESLIRSMDACDYFFKYGDPSTGVQVGLQIANFGSIDRASKTSASVQFQTREDMIKALRPQLEAFEADHIIPTSPKETLLAGAAALRLGKSVLHLARGVGDTQECAIYGKYRTGQTALLLSGIVTDGYNEVNTIGMLINKGVDVVGVACLVDAESSDNMLGKLGLQVKSVFDVTTIGKVLHPTPTQSSPAASK